MKPKMLLFMLIALLGTVDFGQAHRVMPEGTEIKVRTDIAIPAKPAANTKYTATVSNDVTDNSGAVAIPKGARAQLVAVPAADGKDTNLDLRSVTINSQRYVLTSQTSSKNSTPAGPGATKRTAKYVAGG